MRITTALDVLGVACLAVAAFLIAGAAGTLVVVGVALLLVSWVADR